MSYARSWSLHPIAVYDLPMGAFFEAMDDVLLDGEQRRKMKRLTKRYVKDKKGRTKVIIPVLHDEEETEHGRH